MNHDPRASVLRQLRYVVASWKEDSRTDIELLNRFAENRDEQAFSTLIGRYSRLVWGVCRRVLRNETDAEDAFQATFLRLARDASRIRAQEALSSWLYRAARCSAIDLRRAIGRQKRLEERLAAVVDADAGNGSPHVDVRALLDEQLDRLPEQYRSALILCCLEGRSIADAALELNCSVAALYRRLVTAQDILRRRLAREGKPVGAIVAAGAMVAAPQRLLANTLEASLVVAENGVLPATRAGQLASGILEGNRLPVKTIGLGLAFALATVAVGFAAQSPREQPSIVGVPVVVQARPEIASVSGVVLGPDGEPVPGARVSALVRSPYRPGARGLRDEVAAEGHADGTGRYRLPIPASETGWTHDRVVVVKAESPGMAPSTRAVAVSSGSRSNADVQMSPARPLRGRLVDEMGKPAVGVRVQIVRIGDAAAEPVLRSGAVGSETDWPATVTGADGRFVFPDLGGTPNVWACATDPRYALEIFRPDAATNAVLSPARTLVVTARGSDGTPIPRAKFTVIVARARSHAHLCATGHALRGPRGPLGEIDAEADETGTARFGLDPGSTVELLVHPPTDSKVARIGIRRKIVLDAVPGIESANLELPRGTWVDGTVRDESGRPLAEAAVHWGRPDSAIPEWRDDVLVGRDSLTHTDADGRFRLAVLPGTVSLRVHGPTLDYRSEVVAYEKSKHASLFAHGGIANLAVTREKPIDGLEIRLRSAPAVSGELRTPGKAAAFCSGRVSAVRGYSCVPIPAGDGRYSVPGVDAEATATAYLLDAENALGSVVEIAKGIAPPATLAPCGSARIRVLRADGQPLARTEVTVSLLVERDRRPGDASAGFDPQPVDWLDPVNYSARPVTDANGYADLPALIPGARYVAAAGPIGGRGETAAFAVESGECRTLPDLTLPEKPADAVRGVSR